MNIAIIGAGVFGLASAIELLSRGHQVTVLEQGTVPYSGASSTDVSKGIRRIWYAGDNETYVELVERAASRWMEWEKHSKTRFFHRVGILAVLSKLESGDPMHMSIKFLQDRGAKVEVLSSSEARRRFPQFHIANHEICVYDGWSGYIESARAVSFMAQLAKDKGALLKENSRVTLVDERSSGAYITYDGSSLKFDRVIVATGAWIGQLLPVVGNALKVTHQQMLLIEPVDSTNFQHDLMPCWTMDPDGEGWYGFPLLQEGYVKVSKEPLGDTVDPDMDRVGTEEFAEKTLDFLRRRIPEMSKGRIVSGRSCLYTTTPDDHFIIDHAPGHTKILIAGGGSGHGFKFGASIGPVIADLMEDKYNPLGFRFRIGNRLNKTNGLTSDSSRGFARPTSSSDS